jgi:hypothetical protein
MAPSLLVGDMTMPWIFTILAQPWITWVQSLPQWVLVVVGALLWVLVTLSLSWRGMHTGHYRWFIMAGLISGGILAIPVTVKLGVSFQGAVAGFLAGIGVDNISSKETAARKAVGAVSSAIQEAAQSLLELGGGPATGEDMRAKQKSGLQLGIWTVLAVSFAALLVSFVVDMIRS